MQKMIHVNTKEEKLKRGKISPICTVNVTTA